MARKEPKELPDRRRFLLKNLLRGFLWLAVIVVAFIYARKNYDFTLEAVLGPVYDQPTIVYLI
ncbi:MAG: hypothetical protein RJQ14_06575, partial [Marinoscillum sp.]